MRLGLILIFYLFVNQGICQVLGCTDPLALNFYSNATQNDGSCTYSSTTLKPFSSRLLQNYLPEISGLVKLRDGLWGHNDNSDCRLYRIDTSTGFVVEAVKMNGGLNRDWEDVGFDDSFVFMGDFGNNFRGNRQDLVIYKWRKSALTDSFVVQDSIRFVYPEQKDFSAVSPNTTDFDCEAMVVVGDSIYLFTKEWGKQGSTVYRLSKKDSIQNATKIAYLPVGGLITSACYNPKYNSIVLLGYSDLLQPFLYLIYDLKGFDFQRCNKRKVQLDLPFYQAEGIELLDDYTVVVANERFSNAFIKTQESLQYVNLSLLLGDYYKRTLNAINFTDAMMRFEISQNPGNAMQSSRLIIRGANRCILIQQEVKVLSETGATLQTLFMGSDSVVLPRVSPGLYLVGNAQLGYVKWVVE
jgi:hypothetical protein